MFAFIQQHFLFCILVGLWAQVGHVEGRLTIELADRSITVPTSDYFFYRQPYYKYEGVLMIWSWDLGSEKCTLNRVNLATAVESETLDVIKETNDLAIMITTDKA